MFNRFVGRELVTQNLKGLQMITDKPGINSKIHAIKIPSDYLVKSIPLYLKPMDYDLIYFSKDKQEHREIDTTYLNTNKICLDFFDLTEDVYDYCSCMDIDLNIIYYTSYKNRVSSSIRSILEQIIGDETVKKITIFIDCPVTQQELLDTFRDLCYNLVIYSTFKGILQMNPVLLSEVIQNRESKILIKDTKEPEPVFQNSIDLLQDNFNLTLIAFTVNCKDEIKSERVHDNQISYKEHLVPNWLFERLTLESNLMVYDRRADVDIFPSRIDNYDKYDINLPTMIITNSKYDLQFCYNLYLFDEYLKVYLELIDDMSGGR